jgi:hypothetical protein
MILDFLQFFVVVISSIDGKWMIFKQMNELIFIEFDFVNG